MGPDKDAINEITNGHPRFISPYDRPEPYTILDLRQGDRDDEIINDYYERLRYAVSNAESLINGAFDDSFFDAVFIDKDVVTSPAQMCSGLIFDSFVMYPDHKTIGACLTNADFMPGHFIDVAWDERWNIISAWIN